MLPTWRQHVFIDFSKALPINKSVISNDSGDPRIQTPIPILLAHSCDYL